MAGMSAETGGLLDLSDLDLDEVRVTGAGNGAVLEELPPGTAVQLGAVADGARSCSCSMPGFCGCNCSPAPNRPH